MRIFKRGKAGKPAKTGGRVAKTWQALIVLGTLAAALSGWNLYSTARDVRIALGPQSETQRAFFVRAADRPDINEFYKNLEPDQRRQVARNIGRYNDPELAKLIGALLADFDAPSRELLAKSLVEVAKANPEAVAKELNRNSAFQRLGLFSALRSLGPQAIPVVASQLESGDQRANAAQYLVEVGDAAVPALMDALGSDNKDTRTAAADALGKIRTTRATDRLLRLFAESPADERVAYVSALASIGDPASEPALAKAFLDAGTPSQIRVQAALGLGRMATSSSLQLLWRELPSSRLELGESVIDALALGGDAAFRFAAPERDRVKVAASVQSPVADDVLRRALSIPDLRIDAAAAAEGRPTLAPALDQELRRLGPQGDGNAIDALLTALASTDQGATRLQALRSSPDLAGFVARREAEERP